MTRSRIHGLALLLALAACGDKHRDEDHHEETEHRPGSAAPERDHGAPEGKRVTIAPEMIRDLRVTTTRAESRTAGERASVLGELRVNDDAYAEVAAPIAARVVKVLVKAGDTVAANQPLVELSSPDLGKTRAEAAAAATRVELAKQTLARKVQLYIERLVPEREVIEARAAVADAEAGARIASAAAGAYGAGGGGGSVVRSPIAGTVIERSVVMGQLADPAKTLFRIGDLGTLWLIAHVFERDAVRVTVGATASASFAALPGVTTPATVTWIGREVESQSRTIPVRLEVPNPDGALRPGMSATVSLPLGSATGAVIAVPVAAVQRVGEGWAVFVPRSEGVFDIRPIGRGRDLGGEVEVLSGLAVNETVVVDGAFLLKAEADKARGEGGDHDHH